MEEVKQDIDKLELAAELIADALILGKKVYADNSVDLKDLVHAPEAVKLLEKAIKVGAAYKEVAEEGKDLEGSEIIQLVSKAIELVKKVEEAK